MPVGDESVADLVKKTKIPLPLKLLVHPRSPTSPDQQHLKSSGPNRSFFFGFFYQICNRFVANRHLDS